MVVPRQTFLVHVLGGGPRAVVENVSNRERETVADVRAVGDQIADWVDERAEHETEETPR